jgi:hypothetical protein
LERHDRFASNEEIPATKTTKRSTKTKGYKNTIMQIKTENNIEPG